MPNTTPASHLAPPRVLKFGGSSVADAERIRRVVAIVQEAARETPVVVVVSALGGMTNELLAAAHAAASGDPTWRDRLAAIQARHESTRRAILLAPERERPLAPTDIPAPAPPPPHPPQPTAEDPFLQQLLHQDLGDLLHGTALVREASPRTLDAILSFGERLSAHLVALALTTHGTPAEAIDAREVFVTSDQFGNARVLREPSDPRIRARLDPRPTNTPAHTQTHTTAHTPPLIPVVTGFIGATPRGETTTLGRGGSDYTAAVLGAALGSDRIEIWTDVDGVMTADPRVVRRAFPVPELSYAELMELSHFGAKVVYPPTVQPAREAGIPLYIRNTFNPAFPGTYIHHRVPPGTDTPIRGIASISGVALLRLEGDGIVGVPGTAQRLFATLGQRGINVILISQASSERSICLAVDPAEVDAARRAIDDEFALEHRIGLMDPLVVEEGCSVLAVVGEGMRTLPGIAGRVFGILGGQGINIRAIAQGSSELNMSVAIRQSDEGVALRAIHDAVFFPGERSAQLFVAGTGRVGRTFLALLAERQDRLEADRGIRLLLRGLARKSGAIVSPPGIGIDPNGALAAMAAPTAPAAASAGPTAPASTQAAPPATDPASASAPTSAPALPDTTPTDLQGVVDAATSSPRRPVIFVDLTADDAPTAHYARLLKAGVAIVTANKRGLSGSVAEHAALLAATRRGGELYLETTVGAGLPILRTLTDLVTTGDRIHRVEGVISGSLSFLLHRLMDGAPFSEAVREVHQLGYSEPDPRDNLSGADVGRKLLILGRSAGFALEPDAITVEPLLPADPWRAHSLEAFWDGLPALDDAMGALVRDATHRGHRLVYLAQVTPEGGRARLQAVPPEHPAFHLKPGDNVVTITSRTYASSPLVVRGPGAGPEVTAAGVLSDVLRATLEALP
jgi:bifunctional aspartokinase / homoserine dehydrogenase 1